MVPVHDVGSLSDPASEELLVRRFPELAPRVRRRLMAEAQGNPLALLELPVPLTGSQRTASQPLPERFPLAVQCDLFLPLVIYALLRSWRWRLASAPRSAASAAARPPRRSPPSPPESRLRPGACPGRSAGRASQTRCWSGTGFGQVAGRVLLAAGCRAGQRAARLWRAGGQASDEFLSVAGSRCGQLAEQALGLGLSIGGPTLVMPWAANARSSSSMAGPGVASGTSVPVAGRPICRTAARKLSSARTIRIRAGPPSTRKVSGTPAWNCTQLPGPA